MSLVRKKFTGAGSYTLVVPGGVKHMIARGCGGGGGGGGGENGSTSNSVTTSGGGGGGASPKQNNKIDVVPGETLTVVVGGGGNGGGAHTDGGNGSASTITGSTSGLLATFKPGSKGFGNITSAPTGTGIASAGGRWGAEVGNVIPTTAGNGDPAKTPYAGGRSLATDANDKSLRAYGSQGIVASGAPGGNAAGPKDGGCGGGAGGPGPFGSLSGTGGNGGNGSTGAGSGGSPGSDGTEGGGGGGGGAGGAGTSGGTGGAGGNGGAGVIYLEWDE